MKNRIFIVIMVVITASVTAATGEIFNGIGPSTKLSTLRGKFPSAIFKEENPAWAQKYDVVYSITGGEQSGVILVTLLNSKLWWENVIKNEPDATTKRKYEAFVEKSSDDLEVSWIKWTPKIPLSLKGLVKKYGKPDSAVRGQVDAESIKEWSKRGIKAYLSDDRKNVTAIDYNFTDNEVLAASRREFQLESGRNKKKAKK